MIFAASKLVLMVMDTEVFIAVENQAIVRLPAVGIDGGFVEHLALDDGHQCLLGAIFYDLREDLPSRLSRPITGVFPPAPRPRFPRARRGPKYDSSTSTSPANGRASSTANSKMRNRNWSNIRCTLRTLTLTSPATVSAGISAQNIFNTPLNLSSEMWAVFLYLFFIVF